MGSNPTLSATSFMFLYLRVLVSIVVSALHVSVRGLQRWFNPFAPTIPFKQLLATSEFFVYSAVDHLAVDPFVDVEVPQFTNLLKSQRELRKT